MRAPHRAPDEPPRGSPWDDPIGVAPLVFVDLEMTGLDASRDRVIEVCAERTRGGTVVEDRLESLVRPEPFALGNVHIHGILEGELASAPTFADLADRIEALLAGAVIVAHGAEWDVRFLEAELARAGRTTTFPFYLDTLTLARRAFALPSHRLSALRETFALPREQEHRAGSDVNALRALWTHVVAALAPGTPRDLWHVRVGSRHARPAVVAAAVRAADRGMPVRVRYRPASRPPEELLMVVTDVRTDLDPPRVLGYLLPTRGRRDLRADRILAIEPTVEIGADGPPSGAG